MPTHPVLRAAALVQRHILVAMLGIYLLGGFAPELGIAIKHVTLGSVGFFGERPVALSATNLLLASMLFTSGLAISLADARAMWQAPKALAAGVLANALVPIALLAVVAALSRFWHDGDEAQNTLTGLALIGAMPIAGGASVWTQNADGNVPLTVGLVLASTALSPLSIPLALHAASFLTTGDYSEDLAEIAADGIITFSLVSVVLPCALGILLRHLAGTARVLALMPSIKVVNLLVLLTLSYTNASGALVQVVARPDYDLLAAVFAITGAMCLLAFTVGAGIAARLRCRPAETTSLVFGVGMNNSSASAVLAGTQMADHPLVLLPILAYSMTQKVLAGLVDARLRRLRNGTGE